MIIKKKLAVLYHIFYEDTIHHIGEQLRYLAHFEPVYFFNISSDAPDQSEIRDFLLENFRDCFITTSPNLGKDIGGKLLLLKACIEAGVEPDWIVLLHDKKSLQALNAKTWKEDLFKIIDKDQIDALDTIISTDPGCGIIAKENYVINEVIQAGKFSGRNGPIIARLLKEYNIICKNYEYVAGTMFWAKGAALLDFFKIYDPLKIRLSLEPGNVLDNFTGTSTHSWERMFSWIITSKDLTIKTL